MSLINEQITDISSRMSTLQQEAVLTAQEQTELAVLEVSATLTVTALTVTQFNVSATVAQYR